MNNFKDIKVTVSQWGHTAPAIVHEPTDGSLPNGKFPCIFFFHGVGERGNGDFGALVSQGLPWVVEYQGSVKGNLNGNTVKFIVVAVQDAWFSPSAEWMSYAIPFVLSKYNIDPDYVYATGLSAGGKSTQEVITNIKTAKYIAAAAPMSIAGFDPNVVEIIKNQIKTWYFVGESDATYKGFTVDAHNAANVIYPNSSKLTVYEGAHGNWIPQYQRPELYDFLLQNHKGVVIQPTPEPTPARKLIATIKVYDNGDIEKS